MTLNLCFVGRRCFARHGITPYSWLLGSWLLSSGLLGFWVLPIVLFPGSFAAALPPANPSLSNGGGPSMGPGSGGPGSGGPGFGGPGFGAAGGSAQADFDSLINLIQSTVASDSWLENGTGEGDIQPFPTGVLADATSALRVSVKRSSAADQASAALVRGRRELASSAHVPANARAPSKLRFVSLPRLERAIAQKQHQHEPFSIDILVLAGLQRIEYVLISPATEGSQVGELVFAGPAGDWVVQPSGRIVALETGRPIVRLDDLLVMLRRKQTSRRAWFGCSITPRQEALAATQEYLRQTGRKPLAPGGRKKWLTGLRDTLGKQDVEYFGIDPQTRVAQVLLAADYHMKLIGMGLVGGVDGVDSYLSTVTLSAQGTLPPMNVLRWWFAMKYAPVVTNAAHDTFHISGPGIQVLSESEMLAARGQRVHTGQSDALNRRFADSFTATYLKLSQKYPLYAELHNLFDLALAIALIETEGLSERVSWQPGLLLDPRRLRLPAVPTPKQVETVINHRLLKGRHIVAGVSGGVWVDARKTLRVREVEPTREGSSLPNRIQSPAGADHGVWWWDSCAEQTKGIDGRSRP